MAYINLNCGEDALVAAETALKFNPKNVKAVYRQILSLILQDRFEEADKLMQKNKQVIPAT